MKVSFIVPALNLSGGSRVIATYAEMLSARGHEVAVVAPKPGRPSLRRRVREFFRSGSWRKEWQRETHFDGRGLRINIADGSRVHEDDVPDSEVVVATWWETAEWVNSFGARKGAKVYLVQGHEVFDFLPVERVRATYRMPFMKIVVSEWLGRVMRDLYGDSSAVFVPNSVDHTVFWASPRGKQNVPTIGFMHAPGGVKATHVAIEAIRHVAREFPRLRVTSFGREPPRGMDNLPFEFEHQLLPSGDQMRRIYCGSDVWLCSSRSEGFGLPAMEAMACRTPVVSTAVGWAMDAIQNGVNGYVVPVDDSLAMADAALRCLRADDASWGAMSEHAYRTATAYTWDRSYALFVAALEKARDRPG